MSQQPERSLTTRHETDGAATSSGDNLFNYDVHEQIGRGSTAIIYSATCKRGRLRNRLIAIKKISRDTTSSTAHLPSSTELHQTLFHPSIISLFSSFSTPAALYHVLELCPNGTLTQFLHTSQDGALREPELRGAVKGIVDGLIYLRKGLIIHRDIKPSNILLNQHRRVKISDFGLAVRLPSAAATVSTFCGSPNYVSPQIVAGEPYNFTTDLWSLGALIVTCLTGTTAFEAISLPETFRKISSASYEMPSTASCEVRDLVSGLLQIDPNHRIPLHRLLSHPFFNPALPIIPLDRDNIRPMHAVPTPPRLQQALAKGGTSTERPARRRYPDLSVGTSDDAFAPATEAVQSFGKPLQPWKDLRRNFLSDTWKPHQSKDPGLATRRIVSAPSSHAAPGSSFGTLKREDPKFRATRKRSFSGSKEEAPRNSTPALTADSDSFTTTSVSGRVLGDSEEIDADTTVTTAGPDCELWCLDAHPLLSDPQGRRKVDSFNVPAREIDDKKPGPRSTTAHDSETKQALAPGSTDALPSPHFELPAASLLAKPSNAGSEPLRQTLQRLPRLNTDYINPQTRKVLKGQVVILPSKSLLVDLREGERRQGRKGDEVLVVSPDGGSIKVFSAPHLSTPCCLAEPIAQFDLTALPQLYWQAYTDATKVVNHLKQRIPKMILYKPEGQCTLMANEPFGDVEILSTASDTSSRPRSQSPDLSAPNSHIKIRLRQQRREVEILKYISRDTRVRHSEAAAGGWTKKVLPVASAGYCIALGSIESDDDEAVALKLFDEFLAACRAVDNTVALVTEVRTPPSTVPSRPLKVVSSDSSASTSNIYTIALNADRRQPSSTLERTCATAGSCTTTAKVSRVASDSLLSVRTNLPPKPAKFIRRTTSSADITPRAEARVVHPPKPFSEATHRWSRTRRSSPSGSSRAGSRMKYAPSVY